MKLRFPASLRVIGRSIVDWWDSWLDMVLITTIWLIAQITIILGPPATFGYYYAVSSMVSGQSIGLRGLIDGARMYFGKAWIWGGINILVLSVTTFAAWFYLNVQAAWGLPAAVLVLMIGYLWLCAQFYGLPYFMELGDKSLYIALKNGFLTAMAAPFFTVILMVFAAIVIALSFGLVLPLILGLPGLIPIMGFRGTFDRLIAFGLREREKTPREIEAEEAARIYIPEFKRNAAKEPSFRDSGAGSAVGEDVADSEGQVEHKE
jgi:hypothetical protein